MDDGTDWCRHYQGVGKICKAGVDPKSVMVLNVYSGNHYPCFEEDGVAEACKHCSYLTPDERRAARKASDAALTKYLTDLDANVCPFCGMAIEKREQVGRCAYARPCGHRLYQGKA